MDASVAGARASGGWIGLVGWLAVTFLAAAIGSRFMPGEWYAGLSKPDWTPPGWLFGPVWTLLYILMALAAWLVWREAGWAGGRVALSLFLAQLVLNAAWSVIFFGLHRIDVALADIVLLELLIVATGLLFWRHRPLAAMLLAPYALWVGYATALNTALYRLNS